MEPGGDEESESAGPGGDGDDPGFEKRALHAPTIESILATRCRSVPVPERHDGPEESSDGHPSPQHPRPHALRPPRLPPRRLQRPDQGRRREGRHADHGGPSDDPARPREGGTAHPRLAPRQGEGDARPEVLARPRGEEARGAPRRPGRLRCRLRRRGRRRRPRRPSSTEASSSWRTRASTRARRATTPPSRRASRRSPRSTSTTRSARRTGRTPRRRGWRSTSPPTPDVSAS